MRIFNHFSVNRLVWIEALGIGYLEAPPVDYDKAYFNNYVQMSDTPIGRALNQARTDIVDRIAGKSSVLDIGIGSGQFVSGRPNTFGYDINPHAEKWLWDKKLFRSPSQGIDVMTFWDSLEHIKDPSEILSNAKEFVFVSCPIYDDVQHVLRSKHYKPGEHYWYWTDTGIRNFMSRFGFELVEQNTIESDLGREDIGTYVFRRK